MEIVTLFVVSVFVLCVIFFVFIKWRYTYWTRKGLEQLEPEFLFGNTKALVTGELSLAENFYDIYCKLKKSKLQHGGLYMVTVPSYMPVSLRIVKEIMQTQYPFFDSHGIYNHEKDILSSHLFTFEGESWKNLRQKLTPAFTSGKLKSMFEIFLKKTENLENAIYKNMQKSNAIAINDFMERFNIDIIGNYIFGIDCNSLEQPDNDFQIYGTKVFKPRPFKNLVEALLPWRILPYLGHRAMSKDVEIFFKKLVKATIEYRESNNVFRPDLFQMLIDLKNKGAISDDNYNIEYNKKAYFLKEEEIIAQCFLFFSAGYETTSSTSTFALYELAQNIEIQEKARKEIMENLRKNGNKLTYDVVNKMEYLDTIVNETLRKYPPLAVLPRKCTKNRKIPETNITIEKGTIVWIPVWGIHRDPDYYPDPEIFDPGRFSKENIAKRPEYTWLPFGEGPRLCIGKRFGLLQTKMALICMLKKFKVSPSKLTTEPLRLEKASFTLKVKHDIWLTVSEI